MDLTRVQTIGIETGISFTGVTTVTSLNATQGANISLSGVGVAVTIVQSGTGGYVQVGTSSTVAVIDNSGRLLMGIASTTSDSRAVFQASSGSATGGTNIFLQRGSTPASGEKLGLFAFADSQGKVGAEISAYADATWSLGDYPGRIVFSTTPDGSSTVTERLRIDDDGNLILASDTDTYIHHPAADTLAVTTGGSERLRIDSSGRFGIGTNSPSGLLSVHEPTVSTANYINVTNNATGVSSWSNGLLFGVNTSGVGLCWQNENLDFLFGTNNTERLRITSDGKLGLGTSSPSASALLDVNGSARIGSAGNFDTDTRLLVASTGGNSYIQIQGADSTGVVGLKLGRNSVANSAGIDWSASTDKLTFRTNGTTAAMTIDASQRVGIGVTSPADTLHVRGPVSGTILNLDRAGSYSWKFGQDANSRFTITADTSQVAAIDTSGRLLVGTTSTSADASTLLQGSSGSSTGQARLFLARGNNSPASGDFLGSVLFSDSGHTASALVRGERDGGTWTPGSSLPGRLVFSTTADGASSPTERMRISQNGTVTIGQASSGSTGENGSFFAASGQTYHGQTSSVVLLLNRRVDDGTVVSIRGQDVEEGTISVSGTTVSYNGAHLSRWSQLPSGAERIEILRGSVLSNIDEMCEWGDEENEQLNRMKVSDVEGDKNVAGVFQAWDDDDDTYVNDFYCAMTGDFIIRIAAGVTVERGDLLMSAGDGTAKPQDDDIIRSKTIAKVTSTNVSCTYDDGSYCVPCVLMAC